jgi:hypothetical protein
MLHRYIPRKYDENDFEWSILCECSNQKELDEREQFYIAHFDTKIPHGYNSDRGGKYLHLEGKEFGDWRVLSFSHWENVQTWKTKDRVSVWDVRCSCGFETKIIGVRLSQGESLRCNACWEKLRKSDEWKEASRQRSNEMFATPEMKKIMHRAMKEVANRPDVKAKQIARQTGKNHSEERKEAIRKGVLKHLKEHPETREKLSKAAIMQHQKRSKQNENHHTRTE